jgi:hypothetical protein
LKLAECNSSAAATSGRRARRRRQRTESRRRTSLDVGPSRRALELANVSPVTAGSTYPSEERYTRSCSQANTRIGS